MTRANIDQWKRNLRQQYQQKLQTLKFLQRKVEDSLTGMQKKIDSVSTSLQAHQRQPGQLALSLKQEFNEASQIVQNLDIEICTTAKQVKELQKMLTAAIGSLQTDQKVLKTSYAIPIKPCTGLDSGLPSVQHLVLGFLVTPNQYSILSEDEVVKSEPG